MTIHKDLKELGEASAQKAKEIVESISKSDRVEVKRKAESAKLLGELAQGCLHDD